MFNKEKQIKSITRSILRYPGSKARLAKFISHSIIMNGYKKCIFVEPLCGGASVSIALLESSIVESVVINDVDPIIFSLWKCIFSNEDSKWLANAVMRVPLSLDYWEYQKHLEPKNLREAALKCLYLNRTSFSGILHQSAGPLGGRTQLKWDIGCRFNRDKLASRIKDLSLLSSRVIDITNLSWIDVCEKWCKERMTFFYLDPPFYLKAKRLYRFRFNDDDHLNLHEYLSNFKSPWVLSYDNVSEIRGLYNGLGLNVRIIDNTYSAHPIGGNSYIGREIILSNLRQLPLPFNENNNNIGLSVKEYEKTHFTNDKQILRIPMAIY